ncbi:MAG: hypothetical protein BM563_04335 [Bacteroidetes bacterium MedPE-SWsnd-G1]|nr:MAG: hypothetical protein BM563_04335 [Bacteroidetes bacterium MedPE-SWsnd-G1]
MNIKAILSPNSEFDRKQELNKLLHKVISESDKEILKQCTTQDHESIGLIGCILKEDDLVNKARILIASKNIYHESLSDIADELLKTDERELLTDSIAHRFLSEQDDLTEIEDKIYYILMGILSNE